MYMYLLVVFLRTLDNRYHLIYQLMYVYPHRLVRSKLIVLGMFVDKYKTIYR